MIHKRHIFTFIALSVFSFHIVFAENLTDVFWEGHVAYKMKDYRRGAELYRAIIEKGYSDPNAFYNAAGCYALSGDHDKAFEYLRVMCSNEFMDMEGFLNDADFQPLKNDSRWATATKACRNAEKKYIAESNATLYQLYLKSNKNVDVASEAAQQILKLLSSKQLKTSKDYFHAASVLAIVNDPTTMTLAEKLAQKANTMLPNHPQACSLIAVTKDRYLWIMKQPQIYGTQIRKEKDKWTYEPFNPQGVSDQQRAQAHILSLATLYKRLKLLNEKGIE